MLRKVLTRLTLYVSGLAAAAPLALGTMIV
jgi:hypothetical protein